MREAKPRVYPAREDTWLLLPYAEEARGRVLEIGTGNGLLALTAARAGAHVVATDLNRAALEALRERARAEELDVSPVRTDLARGLTRFDRILANPPYLPTPPGAEDPDPGDRLALDGGADGCAVTRRLFESWADHLLPGGSAFVLTSSVQDRSALAAIVERWTGQGGSARRVAHRLLEGERLEVLECALGPSTD